MKPQRILQVLTIMNRGGAETMIMNYYRKIDRTKLQFDFLLHRADKGDFDDEIIALGGNIYKLPPISPLNYFRYKRALSSFFDDHPEYKIIHSHLNALSQFILEVAKRKNIPVRISHSHLAVEPYVIKKIFRPNTDIKATVKDSIQSLIRHNVSKYATHYFACGLKAGKWLYGEKATNFKVINNAIDASLFTYNTITAREVKDSLKIKNQKIIGHVGRFNEQKNHFFLLNIFKELNKKNKNIILVLVGEGNLKKNIEKEINRLKLDPYVLILGLRNDIPDLLQAFDLFLFPSLYEGLPLTLIEAQAAGLSIVASDTITKEVDITNNVTFCSLVDDPIIWADHVLEKLEYDRSDTFDQIVKGNFDIHKNAVQLQNFYLNTIAECVE